MRNHGSGMSGATWAPLMAHLRGRRAIAIELPGFGTSHPHSYTGRSRSAHATAQLTAVLDALGLERAQLLGTSIGGMWALCLPHDTPARARSVVSISMPDAALPDARGDPFTTLPKVPASGTSRRGSSRRREGGRRSAAP